MKKFFILIFLCISAFLLYSFKITQVPPGINGDEVGIGHNAVLISRNLTDENNNFLPLFIFAKSSDWKQPVTVYTTALIFRLFGSSFEALRSTSILFVIVSIIIFYFITKEIFNFRFFIVGSLILITTPIIMIQSHLALENIAVLPFIFFWILMLAKYKHSLASQSPGEKRKKSVYLFLGGISLGIGIFSYLAMRIIVPILSVITVIYLGKNLKRTVYFLLGVVPFFILLYIANFYYPGAVFGHFSAPIPSVNEFLLRYLSVFDFSFLFLKGDATPIHSTGQAGMFLVSTLPVFLIGIWKILRQKKPFEILVLSSFFLLPILFGFVPDIYRTSRLLALVPFYIIISTIGILALPKKLGVIIIILMIFNYWFFVNDYWFSYSNRVKNDFPITINYYNEDFRKK